MYKKRKLKRISTLRTIDFLDCKGANKDDNINNNREIGERMHYKKDMAWNTESRISFQNY